MGALVVRAPDTFAIEDVPRPQPGAHEVRCRVRAVTICGTDPHIIQGHHRSRRLCASDVVRMVFLTGYEPRSGEACPSVMRVLFPKSAREGGRAWSAGGGG
jgi:hypothetical protein